MNEEYPRAFCHEEQVEQKIMDFEQKYSTPINEEEREAIMREVHADHEDCGCDCCLSAF